MCLVLWCRKHQCICGILHSYYSLPVSGQKPPEFKIPATCRRGTTLRYSVFSARTSRHHASFPSWQAYVTTWPPSQWLFALSCLFLAATRIRNNVNVTRPPAALQHRILRRTKAWRTIYSHHGSTIMHNPAISPVVCTYKLLVFRGYPADAWLTSASICPKFLTPRACLANSK